MKAIILNLFIAVGLFLGSCSDQSSVTGPSQQDPQSQSTLTLIKLGTKSLHKPISISQTINGNTGGSIDIVGSFDDGVIQVNGTLTVPAGAYVGNQTITVYMEGTYAVLDFGPSPFTFDIPLNFTMEISGVDLHGINPHDIVFGYISDDDSITPISMGTTASNKNNGILSVYDAQLPHFSRYGWGK